MGYWNTRGLRGSTFEEMINLSNDFYFEKGLAVIQKVPTPITPVELDSRNGNITLAYFEKKSTVDYIGAVQGIPVCFDAKETARSSLPLQNIHGHQIEFMDNFQRQRGLAFFLVSFMRTREMFYLPFDTVQSYWKAAQRGGRKSIPYSGFDRGLTIKGEGACLVHYLQTINTFLARGEA